MKKKSKTYQIIFFIVLLFVEVVTCIYSHMKYLSAEKSSKSLNYLNLSLKSVEDAYNELGSVQFYEKLRNGGIIALIVTFVIMYICIVKKKSK